MMRTKLAAACALTLLILSGCAGNIHVPTSAYCLIYEPVYTSDMDTLETIEAVARNNAVFEELCR